MLNRIKKSHNSKSQTGAAAVEFALVAMLLFILLFGIIEFARMFYVLNTVQEVTRRAAREAVVSKVKGWSGADENAIKQNALFGNANLPAFADISNAEITIEYLTALGEDVGIGGQKFPDNPEENILACLNPGGKTDCIAYVRVSITGVTYAPMVGLFTFLAVPIPASTVTMPAESMGYSG